VSADRASATADVQVRAVRAEDLAAWTGLFIAYRSSGGLVGDGPADVVWSWIGSDEHATRCHVAVHDGALVGFVHFRAFERPILATRGLWVDDLFVDPVARGRGVAARLLDDVRRVADAERYDVVRWTTRESNEPARRAYDRIATQADVVVYNATPLGSSPREG
jgi:GNAT superfamily N-acetyltransferase